MQLIVCGSRDLRDRWIVEAFLGGFYLEGLTDRTGRLCLYEGGQRMQGARGGNGSFIGADYFASEWARYKLKQLAGIHGKLPPKSLLHVQTLAEWDRYSGQHPNPAGFIRNQKQLDTMMDNWRPGPPFEERALAVGFINKPREQSRGTDDMLTRCEKAGIATFTVDTTKGFWHVTEEAR